MARGPAREGVRIDERLAQRGGVRELLRVPAALFGALARARGALYARGWLPSEALEVPVVSVGNLSAGGTGKTPTVAWIARALAERGRRPGLVSRGFGRGDAAANDEGRLLARLLPDVPHEQDPDRVAAARRLAQRGVDAIVLDDGFQHRRLRRDLDLVLVDALRPWGLPAPTGGGAPVRALLPRGLLREPPAALARADLLLLTRADALPGPEREELLAELARLAPGRPIAQAEHRPVALTGTDFDAAAAASGGLERLREAEVDLVSAIGNPAAFRRTVEGLGARVRREWRFPDHHRYTAQDLAAVGEGDGRPLVTTAKDAVKLGGLGLEPWVLHVELVPTVGQDALLERLDALPEAPEQQRRRALHAGLAG